MRDDRVDHLEEAIARLRQERPGHPAVPGIIYVIHAPFVGLSKIGITSNMKARFSSIRLQSPVELELFWHMGCLGDAKALEFACHTRLIEEGLRSHGEWFRLEPQAAVDVVREVSRVTEIELAA